MFRVSHAVHCSPVVTCWERAKLLAFLHAQVQTDLEGFTNNHRQLCSIKFRHELTTCHQLFLENTMADDNTLIKKEIETQTKESGDLIRNNEADGN